jgi:hypothetical protein
MSITIIILIGVVVLLLGVGNRILSARNYRARKRRSIEIDIKQMMVGAKEEAQKITDEAKKLRKQTG